MARLKPRTGELDAYIRAGFQLIPLNFYDVTDSKGRARGKSPLHGQWQKKEYDNASVVKLAEQGYNVGVRLTAEVMVLDVDPRNFPEGRDSLAELVKDARLDLSTCPHTITGSGGDHFWFRKPVDVSILDSLPDYQGVEFKSRGRQVVASGSVHPNGTYYEWDDFAPAMTDLPDLPHTLLSLIRRAQKSQGEAAGYGEMDSERLEQTLALLDPSEFRDHEGWLNLMMACHHATAGEGRQEFIDWSTSDPAFIDHGREVGYRWDSLDKPRSGGRPVTIKYLYKVVQERGLEVPPVPPEEDFDVWDDVEEGDGVDTDKLGQEPERTPLDEMNEKHACVSDNGKFRIVTWEQDPVLKRRYITKSTKGDFIDVYGNRLIETPAGGASMLGKWWLAHPMRRQYRGIIFDPSRDHEGWLNLWEGWAYTPKKGDWSIMQELVLDVLCNGVKAHYEYVMNWLAYMVQYPSTPAEVALVFRGEKGTGKGTLGRMVASMCGAHGLHIGSPEHLTGRFNSHLQNVICLFADEAFWAGDKSGESKLKALVTEPTITIEGKGVDVVTAKNLIHIIMASNSEWVVPAGLDGERRFAVFEVSSKRRGDKPFFGALNTQMYVHGGIEAMLFDLLTRDITDWAPRNDVPQTKALAAQKLMTATDFEKWWFQRLSDGFMPNVAKGDWDDGPIVILTQNLFSDYRSFCKEMGITRYMTCPDEQTFGSFIRRVVSHVERKQITVGDGDFTVKCDKKGRAMAYILPSLPACRTFFEEKLGIAGDWATAE